MQWTALGDSLLWVRAPGMEWREEWDFGEGNRYAPLRHTMTTIRESSNEVGSVKKEG
jgi:hypothetical protein